MGSSIYPGVSYFGLEVYSRNPVWRLEYNFCSAGKEMNHAVPWSIYTLSDPRDEVVRYVGVSINPQWRLAAHLSAAKKGYPNKRKCEWIVSLLMRGIKPIMSIVETGTGDGWNSSEIKWMDKFKKSGCDLLNEREGGLGNPYSCYSKTSSYRITVRLDDLCRDSLYSELREWQKVLGPKFSLNDMCCDKLLEPCGLTDIIKEIRGK